MSPEFLFFYFSITGPQLQAQSLIGGPDDEK